MKAIVELGSGKEKQSIEVSQVMSEVPPLIIVQKECAEVAISFVKEKEKNFYIADLIASQAHGVNPRYNVPADLENLVEALAAFYQAEYNLVCKCRKVLLAAAIKEHLLPEGAQPKDFYQKLLEDFYIATYSKLQNDTSDYYKRRNSQQKRINTRVNFHKKNQVLNDEFSNLVMPINDPNKSRLENQKNADIYEKRLKELNQKRGALQRSWLQSYGKLIRLRQLLIDVADDQRKKSAVIATADDFYSNAIKDKLRAEYEYYARPALKSLSS
jgi:hypothetical protein